MLNKLISQFTWQHKRPRIRLKILHLAKNKGGLALPNLKFYYWAAQLAAIVDWISGDKETKWTQIEQGEVKGAPLSVLPFVDLKHVNKMKIGNEWIKHTIKVCAGVKKMFKDNGSISRAMPIVGNIDFPPLVSDHGFRKWAAKGLIIFNQLFEETHLKSFTQLQEQFDLPSNDFYRYLQIRHYIINHKDKEQIGKFPNSIEQYFIEILEKRLPLCKHVSYLYKRHSSDLCENTYNITGKWELETNTIIENELWDTQQRLRTSHCC